MPEKNIDRPGCIGRGGGGVGGGGNGSSSHFDPPPFWGLISPSFLFNQNEATLYAHVYATEMHYLIFGVPV
mgnify:CR=1 FL=1